MQTVAAPASVRDRAFGICRGHGFGALSTAKTLHEEGAAHCCCDLLIDLEEAFQIELDDIALWREVRIADLVALVERKVNDRARVALLPANDDAAGAPAAFVTRQPMVGPPSARQVRDRARRARRRHRSARDLQLVAYLALLASAIGATAALAMYLPAQIAAAL